jgi:hypothetical protein
MALDFHYHPDVQDNQDNQDIQGVQYIDDIPPPYAPPLRREGYQVPMAPVSELKTRLSAALSRTNTPLTSNEQRALREALDKLVKEMSEGWVLIDDMYEIPLILSQVEAIPPGAKRGIRGNGGSRRCRNKKRTLRKKKRTLRKKKRTLSKRTLKKRSF